MEALAPVAAVSAPAPIGAAAVPAAPITEGIPLKQEEVHSAAAAAIEASKKAAHKKPASKADDLIIPKGSVKRVIKIDKDVRLVAADAVLVITKATELFLEKLGMSAFERAQKDNRKMVKYEDVAAARAADENLEFLDGIIPPPRFVSRQQ